ncbi:MAG: tetratricopeptide repeat protein [Gammaproteobacteria bacterium]
MFQFVNSISRYLRWLTSVAVLMLAACASSPDPVEAPVEEAPVGEVPDSTATAPAPEEAPLEEARTYALPDDQSAPMDPGQISSQTDAAPMPASPPVNTPSNPAVVALLDTAAAQANSGDADQAAATLERALRIEPKNPLLWHRLAVLRMQQGRYDQALELATRSNALANGDARLLQGNQQVIDQCRAALAGTRRG